MKALALLPLAAALFVANAQGSVRSDAAGLCTPHWRAVANPRLVDLADVVALSPTNVWAVGRKGPEFASTPVIAHWDGRKLTIHQPFRPTITVKSYMGERLSGEMTGIAAAAPNALWAVGTDGLGGDNPGRPIITHWDGRRWQLVRTPDTGASASLAGVTMSSARDAWAVGQVGIRPLAEHWDGRRWNLTQTRREGAFSTVDGDSLGNVWAVGAAGLRGSVALNSTLAMRWDGRSWRLVDSPEDCECWFVSVQVVAATDVWVTSGDEPMRWNGHGWRTYPFLRAAPSGSGVDDILAVKHNDVWGVGYVFGPTWDSDPEDQNPLIVHWDGHKTRVQHTPFESIRGTLRALSAISPTDIWAAGDHLIARYSC